MEIVHETEETDVEEWRQMSSRSNEAKFLDTKTQMQFIVSGALTLSA